MLPDSNPVLLCCAQGSRNPDPNGYSEVFTQWQIWIPTLTFTSCVAFRQGPFPLRVCFLICKAVLIISVSEGYWGDYIRRGSSFTQDPAQCIQVPTLVRWAFDKGLPPDMAAQVGFLLCFSAGVALLSMCPEINRCCPRGWQQTVPPPPPLTQKRAPNSFYSFFTGQRGGGENKKVGDWWNVSLPLTHCGHITSI